MSFTAAQLEAYRDVEVDDLVGGAVRLCIVGINPGLWTAATNTHFAHPSNRFYPALHRAGITPRELDRVAGLSDDDRALLVDAGVAITNLVRRATARASELTTAELRSGAVALEERVAAWQPRVVAIAGVTAYRQAFSSPRARLGPQPEPIGGRPVWVVPNPSGLNAHETVDTLATWYRRVALAAGVVSGRGRGRASGR